MTIAQTMGQRIAAARNETGLSQRKLAEELGVTQGTIANLESGRRGQKINPDFIARLSQRLGKTASWIMIGDEQRPSSPSTLVHDRNLLIAVVITMDRVADRLSIHLSGEERARIIAL